LHVSFQASAIECPVPAAFGEERANAREDVVMMSITGRGRASVPRGPQKELRDNIFPKKVTWTARMRKKKPNDRILETTVTDHASNRRYKLRNSPVTNMSFEQQ
jgi:hypothetical protein